MTHPFDLRVRRRDVLRGGAPFFVNCLVRTYGWFAILADEGFVNRLLSDLGRSEPVPSSTSRTRSPHAWERAREVPSMAAVETA